MEMIRLEIEWKKSEQHKLNFYKCEYEPIWEKPEQLNYVIHISYQFVRLIK